MWNLIETIKIVSQNEKLFYKILVIETEPEYKSLGTNLISISDVLINL